MGFRVFEAKALEAGRQHFGVLEGLFCEVVALRPRIEGVDRGLRGLGFSGLGVQILGCRGLGFRL